MTDTIQLVRGNLCWFRRGLKQKVLVLIHHNYINYLTGRHYSPKHNKWYEVDNYQAIQFLELADIETERVHEAMMQFDAECYSVFIEPERK